MIETAAVDCFSCIHAASANAAAVAVRENAAQVVLLSLAVADADASCAVRSLVTKSPGVSTIAVLGEAKVHAEDALLRLGAIGVRSVVNLAEREGWNRLRKLIETSGSELSAAILARLVTPLPDDATGMRSFFGQLVRLSPRVASVKELASALDVHTSTLMSRFFRRRLPSPKMYLSHVRLIYAASYLESPRASIANVANRLAYSSPQSFGRHVQTVFGLTAGEFRREFSQRSATDEFIGRLIAPYLKTLRWFEPIQEDRVPPWN